MTVSTEIYKPLYNYINCRNCKVITVNKCCYKQVFK